MQTILVASASANTGSKVVQLLSESGSVAVRALVRSPDSDAAKALAALPNVTVVKGDFNAPDTVASALAGCTRAFLVSGPGEDTQYDREVAFIAAATEAGLEAVVRISTANILISLDSKGVYAKAHARIEQYIEQHKSKVVDLQPNWFMSNWLSSAGEAKATSKITFPVGGAHKSKSAMIDPRDVAGAAAAILLAPKEKLAEFLALGRVQVHGPELLSFSDKAEALSKACGKEITINAVPPDGWVAAMVGFGLSEYFASSFKDTILMVAGEMEPARPLCNESSPLLLSVWKPKYTIHDWAKEVAPLFT